MHSCGGLRRHKLLATVLHHILCLHLHLLVGADWGLLRCQHGGYCLGLR
jgi:hypothetical protein